MLRPEVWDAAGVPLHDFELYLASHSAGTWIDGYGVGGCTGTSTDPGGNTRKIIGDFCRRVEATHGSGGDLLAAGPSI